MNIIGKDFKGNDIKDGDTLKCIVDGHPLENDEFKINRQSNGEITIKLIQKINGIPLSKFASMSLPDISLSEGEKEENILEENLKDFEIVK